MQQVWGSVGVGKGSTAWLLSLPDVGWWAVVAVELRLEHFWNSEFLAALFLATSNPSLSLAFSEILYAPYQYIITNDYLLFVIRMDSVGNLESLPKITLSKSQLFSLGSRRSVVTFFSSNPLKLQSP